MDSLKGTGVALITPFNEDFTVDYIALEKLINYQIAGNIDYLVLMGTTGESSVLSSLEKKEVVDFCKRINNKRLPLVLGVGGNNTLSIVKEIEGIDFTDIEAILSVSPAYNKPTQAGIYHHYDRISRVSPVPIILYNVPGRTSSNITAETTLNLARDFKNIIAIKEASGDLNQIMQIIKNKPNDFIVISGDDSLTLPMIFLGAEGVISVIAQSHPKEYSSMVSQARKGNIKESKKIHYKLYNYYEPLYEEGNPVGIKACLESFGLCKAVVRPPLLEATKTVKDKLNILNK